jgi:hypothetical protein
VKAAVIMGIGLAFRMTWRGALALGLLLSQGGEFGFVLFAQAQHAQLIAPEAASLFGAIVTLSMATTPFLMALTKPLRADPGKTKGAERQGPTGDAANALIVGYGRFGQTVAQMLNASGLSVTLIDTDVEMIDVAGGFGAKVYFGDGTRLDLLPGRGRRSRADPVLHGWRPDGRCGAGRRAPGVSRRRSSCARSIGARWCGSRIARQVGDPRSDGIGRENGAPGACRNRGERGNHRSRRRCTACATRNA